MALVIIIQNDGTGYPYVGNYDVAVQMNNDVLWRGRIENYQRSGGWRRLIDKFVETLKEDSHGSDE